MGILSITTNVTGLIGVKPRVVYIQTDDTLSEVLVTGYLDRAVREGYSFDVGDQANVEIIDGDPSSIKSVWLNVIYSSGHWSLSYSYPSYIPSTSFSPVFSCETPGDLSNNYVSRIGYYSVNGNNVKIMVELEFTPTFSTASGEIRISGFPSTLETLLASQTGSCSPGDGWSWPASITQVLSEITPNDSYLRIIGNGTNVSTEAFTVNNIVSGQNTTVLINISYLI